MQMASHWQGLCRTSLLAQWSPVSQVWQVVCFHPARYWKRKEMVIWVPTAGQRANPALVQAYTRICCPRGCQREVDGARSPGAAVQQPVVNCDSQYALHLSLPPLGSSLSLCGRHKMVRCLRLSWRAEGRLLLPLLLRGGKGGIPNPTPCLFAILSQLFMSQCALYYWSMVWI